MGYESFKQRRLARDFQNVYENISQDSVEAEGKSNGRREFTYKTIEYPIASLGSDRYPHFVMFYINANSRSQLLKPIDESKDRDLTEVQKEQKQRDSLTSSDVGPVKALNVGGSGVDTNRTGGSSAAAMVSPSHKRIDTAIGLPMPMKVRANYSADYALTEGMTVLGAGISAMGDSQTDGSYLNAISQVAIPGILGAGRQMLGSAVAGATGSTAIGGAVGGDASQAKLTEQLYWKFKGAVINKRQEQMFESMKFRQHHLQWLFLPRNESESENIRKIIQLFKENMHPELDWSSKNSTLIMPSEIDVEFKVQGEENSKISKIATSVITSVEVDYSAVGDFVTFEGTANPVAISLSVMLAELEPLDRSMIAKGF